MRMIMHDWLNGRSAGCLNLAWFGCTVQTVAIASMTTTATITTTTAPAIHEQRRQQWQRNTLYTNNRNTWTCRHVLNSDLHTLTRTSTHINQNGLATQRPRTREWNTERTVCKGIREYAMKGNNNANAAAYESNEAAKKETPIGRMRLLLYITNYQDTCFHATYLAHIRFPRKNSQSQRLLSIHSKLFSENVFNPLPWTKCIDWHLFGMVVSVATF